MTHYIRPTALDFQLIEAEARRMRAETVRKMFSALARHVASLFAHKGAGRTA
jgi:hypothetical protein